jgi:hypothetical protein
LTTLNIRVMAAHNFHGSGRYGMDGKDRLWRFMVNYSDLPQIRIVNGELRQFMTNYGVLWQYFRVQWRNPQSLNPLVTIGFNIVES